MNLQIQQNYHERQRHDKDEKSLLNNQHWKKADKKEKVQRSMSCTRVGENGNT